MMKEKVRAKLTRNQFVSKQPDVEKIKREVRAEAEVEFEKKLQNFVAASSYKFQNRKCSLHIVKR